MVVFTTKGAKFKRTKFLGTLFTTTCSKPNSYQNNRSNTVNPQYHNISLDLQLEKALIDHNSKWMSALNYKKASNDGYSCIDRYVLLHDIAQHTSNSCKTHALSKFPVFPLETDNPFSPQVRS